MQVRGATPLLFPVFDPEMMMYPLYTVASVDTVREFSVHRRIDHTLPHDVLPPAL